MSTQLDINEKMRAILIDWLVDVNVKFRLVPETLFMTVNLIDRYLSQRTVTRHKLQLVGVSSLLIACKYEEIYPPSLKEFVAICD
jgi:G2/mitotic-specific cyclin-B, other